MFFDIDCLQFQISEINRKMNNFNNPQGQWNQTYNQNFMHGSNSQQQQNYHMHNQNFLYQNSYPSFNQQISPASNLQSDSILKYNAHDMEPYNNEQFLCKTFNYKVQYIQAFLALPSQLKLKFYMSLEEARLYGQIKDRQGYQSILQKIAIAAKILQGKPLTQEQKNIHKPKSMEDKINQLCDYQFSKLHISDHQGKPQQQEEQFDSYVSSIEVNYTNGQDQSRVDQKTRESIEKTHDIFAALDINGENRKTQQKNTISQSLLAKQNSDSQQNKKTEDEEDQFGDFNDSSNNNNSQSKYNLEENQIPFETQHKKTDGNLIDEDNSMILYQTNLAYIPSFDQLYPNKKKIDPFNVQRPKFAWMEKLEQQETFKVGIFDMDLDQDNIKRSSKQCQTDEILGKNRSLQQASTTSPFEQRLQINGNINKIQNNEQEEEFQDFTSANTQNIQLNKKNEVSDERIVDQKAQQAMIDFKSAYQSYQSQLLFNNTENLYQNTVQGKNQLIVESSNDTSIKFEQNNVNSPQKQIYKFGTERLDLKAFDEPLEVVHRQNKQVQKADILADDYDIMWGTTLQKSLTENSSQIYENGSLIQIDSPSKMQVNNNGKCDQQYAVQRKITDDMEMKQVQQQDEWEQAVQQSHSQQTTKQQIKQNSQNVQQLQANEIGNNNQNQQDNPMKKIKKNGNLKIVVPEQQFGNNSNKHREQQKSNTMSNNTVNTEKMQFSKDSSSVVNQANLVASPTLKQNKLQNISSNFNVCIRVQEMASPRNSSRKHQVSRKSSSNANDFDIQSSVDQNNARGSQNFDMQSEFSQKYEMSQISSPKLRIQNDMNKTHAFPAQKAVLNRKINIESPAVETHPLLKPLVIQFSTKNISIQLRNNSFECSAQFYQQVINWLQKLQFKNSELYNHLQHQLETVHKIKELTELYTKAVQQDEQEKLMQALQQSKKQYKLLNSEKTKNLVNFYIKRGNRTLFYDLCAFLIQNGNVSIQFIQKQLPTRTADNFPYIMVALYIMQKNNLIQSIPVYSAKLNSYILRQYQVYRQVSDNLKSMDFHEQQKVMKSQKYRAYVKGLGIMATICKRTCTLAKISSKTMGSLVKVLKVSKELQSEATQYLKQYLHDQKQESLPQLWTHQTNQKIIPEVYCEYTLKQLRTHCPATQIQAGLDQLLVSVPICKLCLGTQNLSQKQGFKIHTQCWNLYRTVNSQMQEQ